jgi:amino acid transporter
MTEQPEKDVVLKRTLGPWLLTLYGLGSTIGAGIYALVGKIAGLAGYLAPLSFLCAALLAAFSALSFAELSGRFPKSAGEAVYVREGFRLRWLSLLTGLLVVSIGIISTAALLRGLAAYLNTLIPIGTLPAILLAAVLLAVLAIWGIKESVTAAAVITLIEIGGLLIIIGVSLWGLETVTSVPPLLPEHFDMTSLSAVMAGAFLGFYAMIGFEDLVNVAEEVTNVRRNMKIAIILTLVITTLLYMGVAWTSLAWVSPGNLAATDAPLALVYETVTGRSPVMISTIAELAVVNGGLILMIMASRVFYGMSRMGQLPGWFGTVYPRTQTPVNAILFTAFLIAILAMLFPLEQLAKVTAGFALLVFSLVNVSLVLLKLRKVAAPEGAITVPVVIPVIGFLVSVGFLGWEILKRI